MTLKVVSPKGVLFQGEIDFVEVPGVNNRNFNVLEGHAPLISTLERGTMKYATGGKETSFDIVSGFIRVKENHVVVCVEQ